MIPEILSQVSLPAVVALSAAACAGGAAVTRFSGPLACTWPQKGEAMLQRLNAVKFYRRIGDNRVAAGAFMLGVVMAGGGLAAYAAAPAAPAAAAAAPSAPARLPSQVAGVIGSGDKLSLRLTGTDGMRTVAIGEVVADGWVLSALTPISATLTKDGVSRQVGLNPTGAMASAQAAATPSRVTVQGEDNPVSQQVSALLAQGLTVAQAAGLLAQTDRSASAADMLAYRTQYNDAMLAAGQKFDMLSSDETQRFYELSNRIEARKTEIRQGQAPAVPFFSDDLALPGPELIKASLGADADEYNAYLQALYGAGLAARRDALIARPLTGPSSYTVPAGGDASEVRAALSVDTRGSWVSMPTADGGLTYTRVATSGGPGGISRDQVQAALRDADAIAKGADPAQLGLTPAGAAALMATVPASVRAAIGR